MFYTEVLEWHSGPSVLDIPTGCLSYKNNFHYKKALNDFQMHMIYLDF